MAACFSQDKFNTSSGDVLALVLITLPTFAGLWVNGFIICVLCLAWVRKKSFNPNEKILFFLGCSRLCYLGVSWLYAFLSIIYSWCFFVCPVLPVLESIRSFLCAADTWASACLCVFYCIKIADFRQSVFTLLKARADRMVPWLLLVSVLVSLVVGTLVYDISNIMLCKNISSSSVNLWRVRVRVGDYVTSGFFISGSIFAAAFIAAMASALLLLFSLWRHKRQMQASVGKDVSMDAHIKAMRSILAFIFIYGMNFTCYVLTLAYALKRDVAVTLVIPLFQCALPVVLSLILVFSNPKLERRLLKTLACVQSRFCTRQGPVQKRKPTETLTLPCKLQVT